MPLIATKYDRLDVSMRKAVTTIERDVLTNRVTNGLTAYQGTAIESALELAYLQGRSDEAKANVAWSKVNFTEVPHAQD